MELLKRVFDSEIRGIDEIEQTLTAFISTDGIDRYGEVLDPSGMDMANYRKNPVVLWAHNYDLPPIGKALWTKKDGNGVISKVKFANTDFAQEIFQLYKDGFMKAFSVGFIPKETEYAQEKDKENPKKPRLTYKKWELLEYSAVPVPANPEAVMMAVTKGVLRNPILKDTLEKALKKEDLKPKEEPPQPKEEKEDKSFLDELIAENESLKAEKDVVEKELSELKFKLYSKVKAMEEKLSGITGGIPSDKVGEIVARVIRKMQGKLD